MYSGPLIADDLSVFIAFVLGPIVYVFSLRIYRGLGLSRTPSLRLSLRARRRGSRARSGEPGPRLSRTTSTASAARRGW